MSIRECPFCQAVGNGEGEELPGLPNVRVLLDSYPISEGHRLIVPLMHEGNLFNLPEVTYRELWEAARIAALLLVEEDDRVEGFTVGVNVGETAGQTVPHVHLHLVPRSYGDTLDPRGGVRWAVPEKAKYWE